MAPAPAMRKVLLRKGMRFHGLVKTGKKGEYRRKKFVGPCEVEMTEAQVKSFSDLLQTAPQVVVSEPSEPEAEEEPDIALTQAASAGAR